MPCCRHCSIESRVDERAHAAALLSVGVSSRRSWTDHLGITRLGKEAEHVGAAGIVGVGTDADEDGKGCRPR